MTKRTIWNEISGCQI